MPNWPRRFLQRLESATLGVAICCGSSCQPKSTPRNSLTTASNKVSASPLAPCSPTRTPFNRVCGSTSLCNGRPNKKRHWKSSPKESNNLQRCKKRHHNQSTCAPDLCCARSSLAQAHVDHHWHLMSRSGCAKGVILCYPFLLKSLKNSRARSIPCFVLFTMVLA